MPVDDPDLFADKFRVKSARLLNWDYSCAGFYFITICTHNNNKFLGKIVEGEMKLSKAGVIAKQCLIDIPKHFPKIRLDEFVVMPNHLHLLVRVETPDLASLTTNKIFKTQPEPFCLSNYFGDDVTKTRDGASRLTNRYDFVETPDLASLQPSSQIKLINYSHHNHPDFYLRLSKLSKQLIPKVVQQFNSVVKKECNRQHLFFTWQSRYYDRIIRTETEYWAISQYIKNNPENWHKDVCYK